MSGAPRAAKACPPVSKSARPGAGSKKAQTGFLTGLPKAATMYKKGSQRRQGKA